MLKQVQYDISKDGTMHTRCAWVPEDNEIYVKYHDEEWGVPVHDDRVWFEFLVLESAQAGLSWLTILKRREGYRACFAQFDYEKVAQFIEDDIQRLMKDERIIRNQAKIRATVNNAQRFLEIRKEWGSFDKYMWHWVDGKPIVNTWTQNSQVPAVTPLAEEISKDLKKRDFKFLGPTIIYAHMQATGLVNDHLTKCWRYGIFLG